MEENIGQAHDIIKQLILLKNIDRDFIVDTMLTLMPVQNLEHAIQLLLDYDTLQVKGL